MKIILVILVLILIACTITAAHAAWSVEEAGLDTTIYPYEINPDATGMLWISSFGVGETDPGLVWQVNPASTDMEYTKYVIQYPQGQEFVPGNPSDARRDGDYFWWVDAYQNRIGRAKVTDGEYLLWDVPGAETFYGTAVDYLGRLWAAEWPFDDPVPEGQEPSLIQLKVQADNTSAAICTFSLPDKGGTRYMAYDHPYLWLGDEENFRIIRLDVTNYQYDSWDLPAGHTTYGLTMDGKGDLWFADNDALVEFDDDTQKLTVFKIPMVGFPQMVSADGERIWYSGYSSLSLNPVVGVLDSTIALSTEDHDLSPTRAVGTLPSTCENAVLPAASDNLFMVTGDSPWIDGSYDELVNYGGWLVFKMLDTSDPWGIAYLNNMVFVVDFSRKSLVKIPTPASDYNVFLPLILR